LGNRFSITALSRRLPAHGLSALLFAMASLVALQAEAQRTDDNAVTAAGEAFGVTVGLRTIGLYGPLNVRGFNPAQAENLRIEGLYYDQQITSSNPFLFNRSDIRVGIAVQSYSFPSPTGIVDYKLRTPGDVPLFSVLLTHGPLNMTTAEIDAQYPLIKDVLGVAASVAHWNSFDYNYARSSENQGFSVLLRIRPDEQSEILPFVGYVHNGEHQQLPAQDWTSWGWNQLTAGVVAKSALGNSWRVTAGVFRSLSQNAQNFNDLMLGPTAGGIADHILDVTPPLRAASYSGDLRLTRLSVNGAHQREMTFDVRGRTVERDYGGDSILGLGSISIYRSEPLQPPPLAFSARGLDQVSQAGVGASYNERWKDVGTLSLGVLETEYRRRAAALQWTSLSSRVVTNDDQVELPPLSTLNVSLRYRVRVFNRPCSARLDVVNVTDQTGLTITLLYQVVPELRRNYTLTLATDIRLPRGPPSGNTIPRVSVTSFLTIGRPTPASAAAPLWACMLFGRSPTIAESLRFGASIAVMFIATAAVRNVAPPDWKARRVGREPACLSERANSVACL
jgi:hypothetical protein